MSIDRIATLLESKLESDKSSIGTKYDDVLKSLGVAEALKRVGENLESLIEIAESGLETVIDYGRIVEKLRDVSTLLKYIGEQAYLYDSSLQLSASSVASDLENIANQLHVGYFDCLNKSGNDLSMLKVCLMEKLREAEPKIRQALEKLGKKLELALV